MTPIRTRHGTREISREARVCSCRNMRYEVLVETPILVGQVESAVDDHPLTKMGIKRVTRHKRLVLHVTSVGYDPTFRAGHLFKGSPMTPTLLVSLAVVIAVVTAAFAWRRWSKQVHNRPADLGVVSTRWISELRRDEPWSSS